MKSFFCLKQTCRKTSSGGGREVGLFEKGQIFDRIKQRKHLRRLMKLLKWGYELSKGLLKVEAWWETIEKENLNDPDGRSLKKR